MKNVKLAAFAARVATGVASLLSLSGSTTPLAKRAVLLVVRSLADVGLQELWHRLMPG